MNATGALMVCGLEMPVSPRPHLRVLLVEDNPADRGLILRELAGGEYEISSNVVETADQFRQQLKTNCPDVVLSDYNLEQWMGTEALEILREEELDVPLILVSGVLGDVTAAECIKQGVTECVPKDSLGRLSVVLRSALKDKQTRLESQQSQDSLARKVEELARSNRDLEQFVYVASHDLQEPLRMVAAYTQLLAERYRGKLDEQADKYINYAVDGAERMQSLIHDLLAFSRVGRPETELKKTDCNEVVGQVIKDLHAVITESGAVINREPLPWVMANEPQLKEVFYHLLGNAIKFRGTQAAVIDISVQQSGNDWVFSVADNGIGMAAENTEAIFTIFNRLHTRTEYSGNGVGLAICKKIIERHGGGIEALVREGEGTIFRFTLPVVRQDLVPQSA
jgi:signal transduction histidine kinase